MTYQPVIDIFGDDSPPLKPLILGIDPGLTGAVGVYNYHLKKLTKVFDMPVIKYKKTKHSKEKRHIDYFSLSREIEMMSDHVCGAVIEDVGAAPGQGVVSTFNFGFVTGLITGIIAANAIKIHTIKPAVWKTLLNLSQDKTLSRTVATNAFPNMAKEFVRVKDDGRAEAALLAKFGERIFK